MVQHRWPRGGGGGTEIPAYGHHLLWLFTYGRGTVVYGAERIPERGSLVVPNMPDRVIIKCAWQPVSKQPEDELFRLAHARGVNGIARLYGSCGVRLLSRGIRQGFCDQKAYQDRELRAQVMGPRCVPLYRAKDPEAFKKAFISLVEGLCSVLISPSAMFTNHAAHHELYEKVGILHRDISINNLMVDSERPDIGVLIDLDFAAHDRDADTGARFDLPSMPGGTLLFRAIDLCATDPLPRSFYRHDLESFFLGTLMDPPG